MVQRVNMQCLKFWIILVLSTSLVYESSTLKENGSKKPAPTSPSPPAGATITGKNE